MSTFIDIDVKKLVLIIECIHDTPTSEELLYHKVGGSVDALKNCIKFLIKNEIIKIQDDNKFTVVNTKNQNYESLLIYNLMESNNIYKKELIEYLSNYEIFKNQYRYKPDIESNFKYRFIRNYLSRLNVISLENDNFFYVNNAYIKSLFQTQKLSLEDFIKIRNANEKIGADAELAILEYEKNRLIEIGVSNYLPKLVSNEDVKLGYDIVSYDKKDNSIVEIYIEVKTMSPKRGFFWSKNEIDTAKKNPYSYFLYLLPHDKESFLIESLKIIADPYKNIFLNEDQWERISEKYYLSEK